MGTYFIWLSITVIGLLIHSVLSDIRIELRYKNTLHKEHNELQQEHNDLLKRQNEILNKPRSK